MPRLATTAIFEVDHPATQAEKRRTLNRVLSSPPSDVRFVPVDFTRDDLAGAMRAAGHRTSARTLLLWEGVTNYLTAEAIDSTLRWCACAAPGSLLLVTYVHRDVLTRPDAFVGTPSLFKALERAGERLTCGMDPGEVPRYLAAHGLALELDMGAAEYRARYFGAAARTMRGHEFYRVALALRR